MCSYVYVSLILRSMLTVIPFEFALKIEKSGMALVHAKCFVSIMQRAAMKRLIAVRRRESRLFNLHTNGVPLSPGIPQLETQFGTSFRPS